MRGTRIFLALVALSITVNARPDGYGVKGGRSYKATASAVASAHATANADGGSPGIAKSSASAIANANSNSGDTSNAFATASAYRGSIDETAASEKGNGYANEPGDSDDLRQSSDYGEDAEYKCINHEDGTDSWNSDAEHVASEDDYDDSKITEESYDDSDCGPGGVKGHGETPGAVGQSRCKDRQSSASHRSPTQDKSFGLSANSQHSTALGSGYEKKSSRPGTVEASHIEKPCAPGDSNCLMHKPSVSNPYPTYDKNPDLSAGSSRPVPIDGGYGGDSEKVSATGSSHATIPCSPGDSICFSHMPDIPNKPYPTSEKNPHVSTGLTNPVGIGGGVTLKPVIGSGNLPEVQCAPGDSKCSSHKPTGSNFFPTYDENPHALVDSQHTLGSFGGHVEQNQRPLLFGGVQAGSPCAPGDWKCSSQKPTGVNPHPTHNENPFLSIGSQHPTGIDSGHGEQNQRPGIASGTGNHPGAQCAPGDLKCSLHESTGSNLYPVYDENPHALVGSQHTIGGIGGHIEQSQRPGIVSGTGNHPGIQCTPGDWKCSSQKPTGANPHPTHNENPFLSVGSQHPTGLNSGHGEQNQRPGIASGTVNRPGVQCAPGDWQCSSQKPTGENPHPTHNENPSLLVGSQHPTGINSGHGEQNQHPGIGSGTVNHPGVQCAPGDWKCSSQKPTGGNPHPTHDGNPFLSVGAGHSTGINSGHGGHNERPGIASGTVNHPGVQCAPGDWKCSSQKPISGNPHPIHNENPFSSVGSQHPTGINSGHGKPNQHPGIGSGTVNRPGVQCAPGDWKCSSQKPIGGNPHPTHNENPFPSVGSQLPTGVNSGHGEQNQRPGIASGTVNHPGVQCAPGDWKCSLHKPSSNLHHENPVSPVVSQYPTVGNSGHVDQNAKPGTIWDHGGSPCAHGDSICFPRKPDSSDSYPIHNGNPGTWGSATTYPTSFDTGYGGKPIGEHLSSTPHVDQFPSSGHKPGASNPFLNGQIDVSAIKKSSNSDALPDKNTYLSNPFLSPDKQVKPPTSSVHPVNPVENHGSPGSLAPQPFPGHSASNSNPSQEKPKPPNPFFSHHVTTPSTSGEKHPGITSGSQPSDKFPVGDHPVSSGSPNVGCYGSVSCSPNKPTQHFPTPSTYPHGASTSDSGYSEKIPNPANPFFTQYGHRAHSSGAKYPESDNPDLHLQTERNPTFPASNVPSKGCRGSVSCPANESSDGPSENPLPTNHGSKVAFSSTSLPGHVTTQPSTHDSNPFSVDHQLTQPDLKAQSVPALANPYPGHKAPYDVGKPEIIHGCGSGILSVGCNGHNGPMEENIHSTVTEGHDIATTTSLNQYGVKGHRPVGVKGGYHHQGHPMKLLGSPELAEGDHFGSGQETSAQSTAIASANANSNAHASSSSSRGGRSSASAKSQAYSSNGGDGSSNSWASSSASASASAFASSYSSSHSHHGWTAPEIPQVPAE